MPGKSRRPGDQVAGKPAMFLGNLWEKMRKEKEKKRENEEGKGKKREK